MNKKLKTASRFLVSVASATALLQVGTCTNEQIQQEFSAAVEATFNQLLIDSAQEAAYNLFSP